MARDPSERLGTLKKWGPIAGFCIALLSLSVTLIVQLQRELLIPFLQIVGAIVLIAVAPLGLRLLWNCLLQGFGHLMRSILRDVVERPLETLRRAMETAPAGRGFRPLCSFDGRTPRIVYTCRSNAPEPQKECPNKELNWPVSCENGWPFNKAFYTHVPVDELFTVSRLLCWYPGCLSGPREEEMLKTLICSVCAGSA